MMSEDINTQPSTDTTSTTTDTNTNTTSLVGGYDDTWSWEDYKNDKMPKDYDTKDFDDNFITIAKDLKLSKEQAYALRQKVLDNDIEEYNTELSTKEANRVKELTDLQQEWGSTFNFRVQSINKLLDKVDGGDLNGPMHKYLQQTGLDSDPKFVKFMDSVVKSITGEDPITPSKNNGVQSVDSVKGDIAALIKNKAYWDSSDPEHETLVQRVQGLYAKLYSE